MNKIDKIGLILSITCAIHCAILPVFVTISPYILLSLFVSEKFEIYILLSSLILSIMSLCFGIKVHGNYKILPLFSVGLVFILIGKFINHNHNHNNIELNFYMIAGGLSLAFSHWLNNRLCKACKKCS